MTARPATRANVIDAIARAKHKLIALDWEFQESPAIAGLGRLEHDLRSLGQRIDEIRGLVPRVGMEA